MKDAMTAFAMASFMLRGEGRGEDPDSVGYQF